jgi:hypothetical protein
MAFDENHTCDNCLFQLIHINEIKQCRFNAPLPKTIMFTISERDNLQNGKTIFPRCPGLACGQWQSAFEEPVIEPEPQLPDRIDKDED